MPELSLDDQIVGLEDDLRLWRKYNSTEWHDDPEYAAAAQELASLKRQAARRERDTIRSRT